MARQTDFASTLLGFSDRPGRPNVPMLRAVLGFLAFLNVDDKNASLSAQGRAAGCCTRKIQATVEEPTRQGREWDGRERRIELQSGRLLSLDWVKTEAEQEDDYVYAVDELWMGQQSCRLVTVVDNHGLLRIACWSMGFNTFGSAKHLWTPLISLQNMMKLVTSLCYWSKIVVESLELWIDEAKASDAEPSECAQLQDLSGPNKYRGTARDFLAMSATGLWLGIHTGSFQKHICEMQPHISGYVVIVGQDDQKETI
jgi:hypothetical protein